MGSAAPKKKDSPKKPTAAAVITAIVRSDTESHKKLKPRAPYRSVHMPYTYQKNAAGEFVCTICSEVKKNQNTMHYHMKKHEGHLPHTCPTCKKEFLHAQTLALHVAAKHSKEDTASLKCPCCPYKTLTKANRILHFMRKHCREEVDQLTIKDQTCPACEKVCNSSAALLYHLSTGCIQLSTEKQTFLTELMA